jgi:hypothetical protein
MDQELTSISLKEAQPHNTGPLPRVEATLHHPRRRYNYMKI